jgi:hypothetical protein
VRSLASIAGLLALGVGAAAWAELRLGVSAEEAVSVMGGPLRPRMARPDQVTSASVDAITTASRLASSGGALVHLEGRGLGTLSLGLEYVHYRFDLDYEFGRAAVDVVGLRALAMARLPLLRVRGAPALTFGFGLYAEVTISDEVALSGSEVDLTFAPFAAGLIVDLHVRPWRFDLGPGRGGLAPGLFARAYRGLVAQLEDGLGSSAPLSSIALGLELCYDLPETE